MKKHVLFAMSMAVVSPLLLAQAPPPADVPLPPATPAQPAEPAEPAKPAEPAERPQEPVIDGPRTTDKGQTSGSVRQGRNSVGATGNPNTKSGKARVRSENGNEYGHLDADGDGALSRKEVRGDGQLSGEFKRLDRNSDGQLSQAELGARAGSSQDRDSSQN